LLLCETGLCSTSLWENASEINQPDVSRCRGRKNLGRDFRLRAVLPGASENMHRVFRPIDLGVRALADRPSGRPSRIRWRPHDVRGWLSTAGPHSTQQRCCFQKRRRTSRARPGFFFGRPVPSPTTLKTGVRPTGRSNELRGALRQGLVFFCGR